MVAASWPPLLFPSLGNYSAVRAIRALRPLRTASRLPGIRRQVDTIVLSLPRLFDVAMLGGFIMVVFGVLGVQLFKGSLRYRCYEVEPTFSASTHASVHLQLHRQLSGFHPTAPQPTATLQQTAPLHVSLPRGANASGALPNGAGASGGGASGGGASGAELPVHAESGACAGADGTHAQGSCALGQACRPYGENPFHGTVSFDDIVSAWLTIFQCITLEGWTDVMYMASRASGGAATAYFVALVLFASLYLLNLFLAVIWFTYQSQEEEAAQGRLKQQQRKPNALSAFTVASNGHSAEGIILNADGAEAAGRQVQPEHASLRTCKWNCLCLELVAAPLFERVFTALILLNVGMMNLERYPIDEAEAARLELANIYITLLFGIEMLIKLIALGCGGYWGDAFNRFDGVVVVASSLDVLASFLSFDGFNPQMLRAFRTLTRRLPQACLSHKLASHTGLPLTQTCLSHRLASHTVFYPSKLCLTAITCACTHAHVRTHTLAENQMLMPIHASL